jgi:diaminopimelate decarboxylase
MKNFLIKGMKFNVCSLRQFDTVKDVVKANNIKLCVRVHPGKGAG